MAGSVIWRVWVVISYGWFGFALVTASIGVSLEHHFDLVTNLPEYRQLFFVCAGGVCRVENPQ